MDSTLGICNLKSRKYPPSVPPFFFFLGQQRLQLALMECAVTSGVCGVVKCDPDREEGTS